MWNQDDCMNVNSGTNIHWTNGFCSGGHGLSIGSVPNGAVVRNITFENTVLEKQQQSVRIKTVSGAVATVSDIYYRNITINGGTSYGISEYCLSSFSRTPPSYDSMGHFSLQHADFTAKQSSTNLTAAQSMRPQMEYPSPTSSSAASPGM